MMVEITPQLYQHLYQHHPRSEQLKLQNYKIKNMYLAFVTFSTQAADHAVLGVCQGHHHHQRDNLNLERHGHFGEAVETSE